MSQINENNILRNLKNDEQSAFRLIFSKYYQPLFIFAQKFVDKDLAKDVVQDCFFDLWKNRETIKIKTSLSAYLFAIVKNRCYKHFKKEQLKSGQRQEVSFQLKQQELQYYINSEKSILEFGIKDRIEKVVGQLPEKCCLVFKESRFNGLTNKEISDKLNVSVKAVEKHITKALKIFRDEFKDIISILVVLLLQNFQ